MSRDRTSHGCKWRQIPLGGLRRSSRRHKVAMQTRSLECVTRKHLIFDWIFGAATALFWHVTIGIARCQVRNEREETIQMLSEPQ